MSRCTWTQDDEDSDTWGTSCGHMYIINEGTPSDSKMKYCCYCGKHVDEELWSDPDCTCYAPPVGPQDVSPPEVKRNRNCPVHGIDPDEARDRMIDDRMSEE